MSTRTIDEQWQQYRRECVPPRVGPVQLQETKRTFYAAAAMVFSLIAVEAAELPEDEALQLFDALRAELTRFNADLMAGRA